MKTPNAPAATKARVSFGRETMPARMPVDDASAKIVGGELRKRKGPTQDDVNLGTAAHKGRSATNASAQFRISVSHKAPQPQQASGTQASGRLVPAVMGQRQAFISGRASAL